MKNHLSLIFVALLLFASCTSNDCKITVTLPNEGNDGKMVYLQELSLDGQEIVNIDSTTITGNTFKFEVKADSVSVRFLTIDNIQGDLTNMVLVFVEKGNVVVNMDTLNRVSGTPLNDKYREFMREDQLLDMQHGNYYQVLDDKSKLRFNFVKEIIDKPAGEFFFLTYLTTMEPTQILELINLSRPQFQEKEGIKQIKQQAEYVMSPEFQQELGMGQ